MDNGEKHHRGSIRLKGCDYSQTGAYFITICTYNRECLFGKIINEKTNLSMIGRIVQNEWDEIPNRFPNTRMDAFIVMPNHIHGMIIVGATLVVAQNNRAGTRPAPTLGEIVGSFKSLCVHKCVTNHFNIGKLWQRNYYEHIIRNEGELDRVREYIINNPLQWQFDRENPEYIQNHTYKNQWRDLEETILYGKKKK